jgi:hypothetical protein
MSLVLLYHLLTVHVLWHAPIYGWSLLVSGWARRAARGISMGYAAARDLRHREACVQNHAFRRHAAAQIHGRTGGS